MTHGLHPSARFATLIGIKYPIIQAAMSGGPSTPALAAAVSNAGGLGSLGCGYLTPNQIRWEIEETRRLTSRPFAVNLFTPNETPFLNKQKLEETNAFLDRFRLELGMDLCPPIMQQFVPALDEQLNTILEAKPPVFSFTFGIPPETFLQQCRKLGILTMGTATHIQEAVQLEKVGVDVVFLQGIEAGGHRGTFIGEMRDGQIGLLSLIGQVTSKLKLPVIAAGGVMNGQDIAACLNLGASGVALGTAFLLCKEAGTSAAYRTALTLPGTKTTRVTRAFSGRHARGLRNRFMDEMEERENLIVDFPYHNALTREIRTVAAKCGKWDYLSLWAGQGVDLLRKNTVAGKDDYSAEDLFYQLLAETKNFISI